MSSRELVSNLWNTRGPSSLSQAPEWMSFHLFRAAETCPLAVALKSSSYELLWAGRGYPDRPNVGAFIGIIVHRTVERIVKVLVESGVSSPSDPKAMAALRELGGFKRMIDEAIQRLLEEQLENPRFAQARSAIEGVLRSKVTIMRELLQQLLTTRRWQDGYSLVKPQVATKPSAEVLPRRFPLKAGTHFEVTLRDKTLKWTGRLDIVSIFGANCTISDLKTSAPSLEHHEQLRIYALLWHGDEELNPSGTAVAALELIYGSGVVNVQVPVGDELQELRNDLAFKTDLVRNELNSSIVPTRPSKENCRHCQVKLLCDRYWTDLRDLGGNEESIYNVIVVPQEARSGSTWIARVIDSDTSLDLGNVVLKRFEGGNPFWSSIKSGITMRLTDVIIRLREDEDMPLVSLTMLSEALFA